MVVIPIKIDLIKKAKRPGYAMKPEYITIHQTGNTSKGANAEMHNRYVHSVAPNPSWHYTVDGGTSDGKKAPVIYQHLPLTENGWHAGDGTNGTGNRKSIAIEICINSDGNLAKAEDNGAWLCAKLIREVGTLKAFPACMKQHYDWSKKNCPAQIRGRKNGWANFLAAVEAHLKTEAEITRTIGIRIDGKTADEVGYLIDNATYVRASYLVALIGGSVTGHGDHINIVLPTRPDPAAVDKLRTDLAAANKKIEAARRALGA